MIVPLEIMLLIIVGSLCFIGLVILLLPFLMVWISILTLDYQKLNLKKGMKIIYKQNNLLLLQTKTKGICVIANRSFKKGEIITQNVVIPVSNTDKLSEPWRMDSGSKNYDVIALGEIQLMNHDENSNVSIERKPKLFTASAKRDISVGEELCIDYLCPLWFKSIPMINLREN